MDCQSKSVNKFADAHSIFLGEQFTSKFSESRILAELNSKVEASTREVSQLQVKLSDTHTRFLEEKAQKNKMQEQHLKGNCGGMI